MKTWDIGMLKKLTVFLEYKAREKDPGMNDSYKQKISSLFNKIKVT